MPAVTCLPKSVLIALAFLFATYGANAVSLCDNFQQPCSVVNGNLWLGDEELTAKIEEVLQQSSKTYEQFFAEKPVKVAIVSGGNINSELREKLKVLGFSAVLPWISESDRNNLAEASVRRQVEEQTKGMPAELQASMLALALKELDKALSAEANNSMSDTEMGALGHELGHIWFIQQFASESANTEKSVGHGYGGWAPDWLDETAAVLMENSQLTSKRRQSFSENSSENFVALSEFLSMEHPAYKAAMALAEKSSSENGDGESDDAKAIILTGEDADKFMAASGGDPTDFYIQVRTFADFLIEQYSDQHVFEKIAKHLASGKSFEEWLSKTSSKSQPSTLKQLEARWQAWISTKRSPI